MFGLGGPTICALLCENTRIRSYFVLIGTVFILNSTVPSGWVLAFIVVHVNWFGSLLFLVLCESGVTLFTVIGATNINVRLSTVNGSWQNSTQLFVIRCLRNSALTTVVVPNMPTFRLLSSTSISDGISFDTVVSRVPLHLWRLLVTWKLNIRVFMARLYSLHTILVRISFHRFLISLVEELGSIFLESCWWFLALPLFRWAFILSFLFLFKLASVWAKFGTNIITFVGSYMWSLIIDFIWFEIYQTECIFEQIRLYPLICSTVHWHGWTRIYF